MPFLYIMIGIAFLIPILVLIMTTAMDGTTTTDPNTGAVTTIEGFKNVWQIIGSVPSENATMSMDLTSMCNINLLYFIIAVFVCVFVADDFRSGYAKNLFTVRPKKSDYVISKTLASFVAGTLMIVVFFVGSMIGGAIAGLPFNLNTVSISNIIMCMLSKIFLMLVFVSIYIVMSVFAKQKTWLGLICSFASSMLLFTMIPMITPLNAGIVNVILCLVGGLLFSIGLGFASKTILQKTSLV